MGAGEKTHNILTH